ncbi:MAG: coenzyme F420-0:L-glutamate ligase [Armatimonadetes bacterium]|nr:coenzyme F420-0:L-glutamate ligase [Armatimonadota bacterium]
MKDLSPVYVDLHYKYYGRNPIRSAREVLCLHLEGDPASELTSGRGAGDLEEPGPLSPRAESNGRAIPVKTHILGPRDDLSEVIRKYAAPVASPEDVVAIAESVVAITQGRFAYVEDIEPGFWARRLNRFFHYDSSLGSVYSMEMAIREVGLFRMLIGVLVGSLGRLVGRKGDFYRITGRGAATIDDCTGTMPPYDKCVVLGPKDPGGTAAALKDKTGLAIAVVDANDLRKVDVLGVSPGVSREDLAEALRHNPQGNADEQTPLVVVKKKGS